MLYNHFTEELLGLQGVKITNVEQEENLIIHLEMERKRHNCICCGTATDTIHDYRLQKIKDIPSFGTVEPIKLVFISKDWYLYGFCRLRNDFRFFKLTRIKNLVLCEETFLRDVPVSLPAETSLKDESLISVKLKFSSEVSFRVYDEFTDGVTADQQGNLYVTADLPDNGVLFSYLLSFGDNVEILEPANVREQMKEKLISMLQKYET